MTSADAMTPMWWRARDETRDSTPARELATDELAARVGEIGRIIKTRRVGLLGRYEAEMLIEAAQRLP